MKLVTILTSDNYTLTFNPVHLVSILYDGNKTIIRLVDGSAYNVPNKIDEIMEEIEKAKTI